MIADSWRSGGPCRRLIPLLVLGRLASGCESGPEPPRTGEAQHVFQEITRVVLEDSPIATIGQLRDFLPYDDRVLVADGMTDRVIAFGLDGSFQGAVGRRGEGPGEFKTPVSLLVDSDSSILVTDLSARLTRLSPGLEVLGVYRLDVPLWVLKLAQVDGRTLLYQPSGRTAHDNFVWWNGETGLGPSFDRVNDLLHKVPYWSATWETVFAVGDSEIFVADNMIYPIRRFSFEGELLDTLGRAPPSWRQARKPEYGEFATPAGQIRGQGWMRSYTLIDGLYALGADWLVVTHRDPVGEYRSDDIIRADVYEVSSGRKVWEDVRLPGPMVRGGECIWLAVEGPPKPWTVACWKLRSVN